MITKVKTFFSKANKKVTVLSLSVSAFALTALPAAAAPSTGDADVDGLLTKLETAFGTIKTGFWYLALAAIPVTLAVLAFFWLRGKFKQSVSGA